MKKLLTAAVLAAALCLSLCVPASAAGAPKISAVYSGGTVTVTGTGFASGEGYTVRVNNTTGTYLDASKDAVADTDGAISVSLTTGKLNSAYKYAVKASDKSGLTAATCSVVFPFTGLPGVDVSNFTDVSAGSWYYEAVKYASGVGLMTGTDGKSFSPGVRMTRAMSAAVVYRLAGAPKATSDAGFKDVAPDSWYEKAVSWCAESGLIKGTGGGEFSPDAPVTREQTAALLYRFAAYKGYDVTVTDKADITGFKDFGSVSGWAVVPMLWAVEKGLIAGTDGSLADPQGTATRAQTAALLMRFAAV